MLANYWLQRSVRFAGLSFAKTPTALKWLTFTAICLTLCNHDSDYLTAALVRPKRLQAAF